MNLTIVQAVHHIATALDEYFQKSPFVYKSSVDTNAFKPALPMIYEFIVEPEDRNTSGYPVRCPAVAIIVEDIEASGLDRKARIGFHCAVCDPSVSEAETVTGNNITGYEFTDGDSYVQDGAFQALYSACLHLGEEVMTALGALDDKIRLANVVMTAPDTQIIDFPFSSCVIHADLNYSTSYRAISPEIKELL